MSKPTPSPRFDQHSFNFLKDLEANNHKEWFDEHRDTFKNKARLPFIEVLEELTEQLEMTDLPLIGSSKTMFRINRDVRFSENKTPYNIHVSGLLTTTGKKKDDSAGFLYLHFNKSGGFMGTGFYNLKADQLKPFRNKIIDYPEEFTTILINMKKNKISFEQTQKLKSMPRGFEKYADHEHAEYLRLKSYIVSQQLTKTDWTKENVIPKAVILAKHSTGFMRFFGS